MCHPAFPRQTYQNLLEVDFLEHGLLYQAVQQQLLSLASAAAAAAADSADTAFTAGPSGLRLLDLGCGDAMQVGPQWRTWTGCRPDAVAWVEARRMHSQPQSLQ